MFYAMQCKTCYSAVRVSVAGVQMESSVRGRGRWVSIILLSGVQQSDGLLEEAVSRSAGSGPDAAVPSA